VHYPAAAQIDKELEKSRHSVGSCKVQGRTDDGALLVDGVFLLRLLMNLIPGKHEQLVRYSATTPTVRGKAPKTIMVPPQSLSTN
jgi:hypothetical protein